MDARRRHLRTRLFLGVGIAATAAMLVAFVFHFGFFEGLQRQWVDTNFSIRGRQAAPKDVVVIGIDNAFFDDTGIRWQEFRRVLYAQVLNRIHAAEPKAVAVDVQFTEPSGGPNGVTDDNALVSAVARFRHRIVLSTTQTRLDEHGVGHTNVFGGDDFLRSIGAVAGFGNFPLDDDGAIRKVEFRPQGLTSLSIVAAGLARGKPITESEMGGSRQWIDFPGPEGTVREYSLARVAPVSIVRRRRSWQVVPMRGLAQQAVFTGKTKAAAEAFASRYVVPLGAFRGKVVVIGATAPSLQDIHATSTTPAMSGPEIQADAIETALRGFPLRSLGTTWNILLILFFGLVVPLVSLRTKPFLAVGAGLVFALLYTGGALLAFQQGRIVSFVYPLWALGLATVGSLAVHYVVTAFEKERVRDVFSRFVPETVVDQVLEQADKDLRLGGREVLGTVMFSDLRGFTSSAEFMPADKVIHVLNHYLHEMSEAILRHGGTLLCYMGDGIYALFGAPIDQEDHADRALAAAREMLTERLPAFNRFMREQGLGEGYFMGVGLNTGPVMTGNVGHERRMDYTAVGDVVNTASRIEGMTKGTPYSVLLAESTMEALREPPADIVFYEEQAVRGRKEKLRLYALDIRKPDTAPDVAAARQASEPTAASAPGPAPAPAPAAGS
ncbi:MAG TPA: adenylate/guanylate cyclase domain-containing protein [Gaiellaceae bacterium]|nr:adenylate/guanylate cyclase domain-containing protein [Gaiellaceae bacterium]